MRCFTLPVVLIAGALCAAPAAAQDAKTYPLKSNEKFEAGDVYTEQFETDELFELDVSLNGQPIQQQKRARKVNGRSVTRVVAVDAKGRDTKVHIYFAEFKLTSGGFDDDTLKGKVIEVTTDADGKTKWRHHAGPGNIASAAQEWLNEQMSRASARDEESAIEKAFTPKDPVAVGGSWDPDVEPLSKGFGMNIDLEKSKATCTLEKVSDRGGVEVAAVRLKASLPVTGFPQQPGMPVVWSKGGVLTFDHLGTQPVTARIAPGENTTSVAMDGEANMGGAIMKMTIKNIDKTVTTLEGKIPELELIPADQAKSGEAEEEDEDEDEDEDDADDGMGGGR